MPTNVSATLLVNSPDTPKSQILMWPAELSRILLGLTSRQAGDQTVFPEREEKRLVGCLPRCIILCTSYRYVKPETTASAILPSIGSGIGPTLR